MCKLPEEYKYSSALFYETGIDNPSINSGRFPGTLWVSCNWFVGVLQKAQKPSHNTQQRPLKVFGSPAMANPSINSGRFPGTLWVSCNWFVGVLQIEKVNIMKVLKTYITIIVLLTTFSCNSKKQSIQIADKSQEQESDGGKYYFEKLSLEDLPSSKDSFYIRFWLTYTSLVDSGKIINLKYRNGEWSSEFMAYRFKSKSNDDLSPTLITKIYVTGNPKLGWKSLLFQLEKLGLYTLNDNGRRENRGLCTDNNILKVEIVKNRNYSEFIYPCWEAIENQEQVNKVVESLKLIESEFGFQIYPLLPGPLPAF